MDALNGRLHAAVLGSSSHPRIRTIWMPRRRCSATWKSCTPPLSTCAHCGVFDAFEAVGQNLDWGASEIFRHRRAAVAEPRHRAEGVIPVLRPEVERAHRTQHGVHFLLGTALQSFKRLAGLAEHMRQRVHFDAAALGNGLIEIDRAEILRGSAQPKRRLLACRCGLRLVRHGCRFP
jgi:hypothetical protein